MNCEDVSNSIIEDVSSLLSGQKFLSKKYGNASIDWWENDSDVRFFNRAEKSISKDFDKGDFI